MLKILEHNAAQVDKAMRNKMLRQIIFAINIYINLADEIIPKDALDTGTQGKLRKMYSELIEELRRIHK